MTRIAMPVPPSRLSNNYHSAKLAFSVPELCMALGIGRATLYQHIKRGEGPRITKIGSRSVILREDVDAWLLARARGGAQ